MTAPDSSSAKLSYLPPSRRSFPEVGVSAVKASAVGADEDLSELVEAIARRTAEIVIAELDGRERNSTAVEPASRAAGRRPRSRAARKNGWLSAAETQIVEDAAKRMRRPGFLS